MTQEPHALDESLFARKLAWDDARSMQGEALECFVGAAQSIRLAVKAAADLPAPAGARQFTLSLSGPAQPMIPQGTYRMRHPRLGDYAIFITAVGRTADACQYEACFTHVG